MTEFSKLFKNKVLHYFHNESLNDHSNLWGTQLACHGQLYTAFRNFRSNEKNCHHQKLYFNSHLQ